MATLSLEQVTKVLVNGVEAVSSLNLEYARHGRPMGGESPLEERWCLLRAGGNCVVVGRSGKEARGVTLHRGTRTAYEAGRSG